MLLTVSIYQDGENEPYGLSNIIEGWAETWQQYYSQYSKLLFNSALNVKQTSKCTNLPPKFKKIVSIRNPDIYFIEESTNLELGGVEITSHSPDGSNVDKRYPYLWISHKEQSNAFIVCPYLKVRTKGQQNRLPYRHSHRNIEFLNKWRPEDLDSSICQIIPVREMQGSSINFVPVSLKELLITWSDIGAFFAHTLASKIFEKEIAIRAINELQKFRNHLIALANACKNNANHTEPSSLLVNNNRWIQVYNTRPDSGHWERGEGQFDSIDGRLMFTLDEISFLPNHQKPIQFEFWLPQLVSSHPWVVEQVQRGYGSKRFRNICIVLQEYIKVKFADELLEEDWDFLKHNPRLLLERLDWRSCLYKVSSLVPSENREKVARDGFKNTSQEVIKKITELLNDENLFFSAHRAYLNNWQESLYQNIVHLPSTGIVLVPRIPQFLLKNILNKVECQIIPAEECTKEHLLMLRQIHRWIGHQASLIISYRE